MKRKRSKAFNNVKLTDKQVELIQWALDAAVHQNYNFLCGDQLEDIEYRIKRQTLKVHRELKEARILFINKTSQC